MLIRTFLALALLIVAASPGWADHWWQSQQPPQAPQIKAEQKSEGALQSQENTKQQAPNPQTPTPGAASQTDAGNAGLQANQRDEQGTEFWPPLLGFRLKVTDSLLVFFTAVLTIFTGLLWVSTDKLWRATTKQARLTRDSIEFGNREFIATHRPKLRVRRFRAHLTAAFPVGVSFVVANVGESAAHIKRFETTIGIQTRDGDAIEPLTQPMELRTLKAGESAVFIVRATALTYRDEMGITDNAPGPSFEVRGMIDYTDDNGVERQTAFWRVRDLQGRLGPKGDPDYEYED